MNNDAESQQLPLPVIEERETIPSEMKERYRLRKILASICKKRSGHGHVLKSQGAAELRMQLIISIYEVLNAKRRHYARVPSLTGRDVLDEFVCDDRSANCFFT